MELSKRSLQKLESIKIAAKQLFNQHGFNRVTMDSIVQHSNVSKGTVYKYFSDKQELYETIIMDIYNVERTSFKDILDGEGHFLDKINRIIEVRVNKYTETHQKFFEDHFVRSQKLNDYMKEYILEIRTLRTELYEEGRKDGFISENLMDETLELYLDIIQMGLAQKYHDLSKIPKEKLTEVLKLIYAGMSSNKRLTEVEYEKSCK